MAIFETEKSESESDDWRSFVNKFQQLNEKLGQRTAILAERLNALEQNVSSISCLNSTRIVSLEDLSTSSTTVQQTRKLRPCTPFSNLSDKLKHLEEEQETLLGERKKIVDQIITLDTELKLKPDNLQKSYHTSQNTTKALCYAESTQAASIISNEDIRSILNKLENKEVILKKQIKVLEKHEAAYLDVLQQVRSTWANMKFVDPIKEEKFNFSSVGLIEVSCSEVQTHSLECEENVEELTWPEPSAWLRKVHRLP